MLVHTGMSLARLSTHRHDACCVKTLAIGFEEKRGAARRMLACNGVLILSEYLYFQQNLTEL